MGYVISVELLTTMDEGYIKFQAHWSEKAPYATTDLADLLHWRERYYGIGFIGAYNEKIGYGNISQRIGTSDQFYISGSATGLLRELDANHFAKVTEVNVADNELWCEGPIVASSESMSHAAIYSALPDVGAVLHAHHLELWTSLLHRVPTTAADAPYGSPEMVASILDLIEHTDLPQTRLFVMEGHEEGLFFFGKNFAEVDEVVAQVLGD